MAQSSGCVLQVTMAARATKTSNVGRNHFIAPFSAAKIQCQEGCRLRDGRVYRNAGMAQ
jgi:hypothetical protein